MGVLKLKKRFSEFIGRVNVQVSIICAVTIVVSCVLVLMLSLMFATNATENAYNHTTNIVSGVILPRLDAGILDKINEAKDMGSIDYKATNNYLEVFREENGIDDIMLIKQNDKGEIVYVVDAHNETETAKKAGDVVMEKLADYVKEDFYNAYYYKQKQYLLWTDKGYRYMAMHPVKDEAGVLKGVLCIGIEASQSYNSWLFLSILSAILIIVLIIVMVAICNKMFKKISNPLYQDVTNTDALTNLKNKNSFTTDMHNIEGQSNKDNYGVVVIDLNGLKHINDTRGHNIGDKYIQDSAAVIKRTMFDKRQVTYRTGGDEFAVIIKDMTAKELDKSIEKLYENIANANKDNYIKLSMSVGYAFFDKEQDRNFYDTYQRADTIMYENKREHYRKKAEKEANNT